MLAYRVLGDDGSAARAARAAADANEILVFERRVGRAGFARLASKHWFRAGVLAFGAALTVALLLCIAQVTDRSPVGIFLLLFLTIWPAAAVGALTATIVLAAAAVRKAK